MKLNFTKLFVPLFVFGSFALNASFAQTYCSPSYNLGCAVEGNGNIERFKLNGDNGAGIDNSSDCSDNILGIIGGIGDYTHLDPAVLTPGNSYSGSVKTSSLVPNADKVKIWIDWDNDGIFDAEDVVATINGIDLFSGQSSFSITVPEDAPAGVHRMRVRMVTGASVNSIDPCNTEDVGEVEDYIVYVDACETLELGEIQIDQGENNSYSFSLDATNADSYLWDFGDGNTSTDITPVHTYEESGTYTVTVTVSNDCDEATITTSFTHSSSGIEDFQSANISLYPNPAKDFVYINNEGSMNIKSIAIYNTLSQKITEINTSDSYIQFSTASLQNGIYFIHVELENNKQLTQKLQILK